MIAERLTGTEPPEVIQRHIERYRRAIMLAGMIGGTWWDCACGTGYGTASLPGDRVIGFDRSAEALRAAEVYGFTARQADLSEPGWSSREMADPDVVISVETLEHLGPIGQDTFVSEVANRLIPGGVFVVACPIGNGPSRVNPWHLWEPSERDLRHLIGKYLTIESLESERYESTSGRATQVFVKARKQW